MIIKKCEFIKSVLNNLDLPNDNLIEIGLSGRSNVGKSSFINAITNNNKLARVSKTPGKTITLNFYLTNDSFYFVDMPGYGYASRQNNLLNKFSSFTNEYIETRKQLKGFIMIIDSRVVTKDDIDMKDYLIHNNIPFICLLSKIDKLKRNDIKKRVVETSKELSINENVIIPYSSYTHENEDKLLIKLEELLK